VTWAALPEIYPGSFFGVLPLKDNALLIYGMRGNAFVSRDLGQTWVKSALPAPPLSLFAGAVADNGDIVLAGASDAVFVSKDGGARFTLVSQTDRRSLSTLVPLPGGTLLVGGEGGVGKRSLSAAPAGGAP
jgi:photosystem II stability/assembly factor-like uncharacterized protein